MHDERPPPDNLIVLPGVRPDEALPPETELSPPPPHQLEAAVEALLFAAGDPVGLAELDGHLGHPGEEAVLAALRALQQRLAREGRGIRLAEVARGWQLRTDERFARWVAHLRGQPPLRLSRAALEVLSVVAYRQPVTRAEIEDLRGVDSGGVLRLLVERGLVRATGRADAPGRPLLYGTTDRFLEVFGLRDLADLPALRDLRELQEDDPRSSPVQPTLPFPGPDA